MAAEPWLNPRVHPRVQASRRRGTATAEAAVDGGDGWCSVEARSPRVSQACRRCCRPEPRLPGRSGAWLDVGDGAGRRRIAWRRRWRQETAAAAETLRVLARGLFSPPRARRSLPWLVRWRGEAQTEVEMRSGGPLTTGGGGCGVIERQQRRLGFSLVRSRLPDLAMAARARTQHLWWCRTPVRPVGATSGIPATGGGSRRRRCFMQRLTATATATAFSGDGDEQWLGLGCNGCTQPRPSHVRLVVSRDGSPVACRGSA